MLVNDTRKGKLAGGKGEAQLVGACQQGCYSLDQLADRMRMVQVYFLSCFRGRYRPCGGVAAVRTLWGGDCGWGWKRGLYLGMVGDDALPFFVDVGFVVRMICWQWVDCLLVAYPLCSSQRKTERKVAYGKCTV